MSRNEQLVGSNGQQQAASYLAGMGIEMLEKIGTPVKLSPVSGYPGRKDIFRVIFGEKVSGDHRGLLPDGSSVLIETKTIYDKNLAFSDMRDHQPDRLSRHASIGRAVSLLVWVHHSGIYVMRWKPDGIEGFGYRKSITPEKARVLHDECMTYLEERIKPPLWGVNLDLAEYRGSVLDNAFSEIKEQREEIKKLRGY